MRIAVVICVFFIPTSGASAQNKDGPDMTGLSFDWRFSPRDESGSGPSVHYGIQGSDSYHAIMGCGATKGKINAEFVSAAWAGKKLGGKKLKLTATFAMPTGFQTASFIGTGEVPARDKAPEPGDMEPRGEVEATLPVSHPFFEAIKAGALAYRFDEDHAWTALVGAKPVVQRLTVACR